MEIKRFETSGKRTIYTFSVESFPVLRTNVYLIEDGDSLILVDTGSGREKSNEELLAGVTAVSEQHNTSFTLKDVTHILITHGHIDHFGGLPFVRQYTDAPIGVHLLDRRVVSNHAERVVFASRRLDNFLESAGVAEARRMQLMNNYLFSKNFYQSVETQFLLTEGETAVNDIDVYHVPGHCPGQVCLQVDDVLLTADHILSRTTPHQAPESITHNMGLGHYLDSLTKMSKVEGVRLALGGHEEPMWDINGRIAEIKQFHQRRLEKVLNICNEPKTIAEISLEMFGKVQSYHVFLALEEAGAHVEYLYQRGELFAANLEEIEQTSHPVVQYVRA